ncbi:hypothetical protein CC2G_005316 [Coprinopsis cinerea AmutBmut pab1-1]|nr:hypothetical protein CC2G_005316 [Coprinopsis cinerea AmutBmut pab1-1]
MVNSLLILVGFLLAVSDLALVLVSAASTVLSYRDWNSLGCFRDADPRRLHYVVGSAQSRTVEKCLEICSVGGFILAGVEYGMECYCGNSILYDYGALPEEECSTPCSGNNSTFCGGVDAMQVFLKENTPYTTGPATIVSTYASAPGRTWHVTGCWVDDITSRKLPFYPGADIFAEEMTVEKCIDACAMVGYTSAGLEYGQECWCGDGVPDGEQDSSGCGMPCLGDGSQACGGPYRLLTYTLASRG